MKINAFTLSPWVTPLLLRPPDTALFRIFYPAQQLACTSTRSKIASFVGQVYVSRVACFIGRREYFFFVVDEEVDMHDRY
jgi:hypothetical protein